MIVEVEVLKRFDYAHVIGDRCGLDKAIADALVNIDAVKILRDVPTDGDIRDAKPSGVAFDFDQVAADLTRHPAFANLIDPSSTWNDVEALRTELLEAAIAAENANAAAAATWPPNVTLERAAQKAKAHKDEVEAKYSLKVREHTCYSTAWGAARQVARVDLRKTFIERRDAVLVRLRDALYAAGDVNDEYMALAVLAGNVLLLHGVDGAPYDWGWQNQLGYRAEVGRMGPWLHELRAARVNGVRGI